MISKVNGGRSVVGTGMPSKDQLVTAYRSVVDSAMKTGKAEKLATPPAGAEKYTHYDITQQGMLGSKSEAYLIKGQLYLKETPVVPNATSTWFKVGPAPLF